MPTCGLEDTQNRVQELYKFRMPLTRRQALHRMQPFCDADVVLVSLEFNAHLVSLYNAFEVDLLVSIAVSRWYWV